MGASNGRNYFGSSILSRSVGENTRCASYMVAELVCYSYDVYAAGAARRSAQQHRSIDACGDAWTADRPSRRRGSNNGAASGDKSSEQDGCKTGAPAGVRRGARQVGGLWI